MNKLQAFVERLRQAGLTTEQERAVVEALDEYNNARIREQRPETGWF